MAEPTHGFENGVRVAGHHAVGVPDPTNRSAAELPWPELAVAVVQCEERALGGRSERAEGARAGVFVGWTLEEGRFGEEDVAAADLPRGDDAVGGGGAGAVRA